MTSAASGAGESAGVCPFLPQGLSLHPPPQSLPRRQQAVQGLCKVLMAGRGGTGLPGNMWKTSRVIRY